MTDYVLVIAGMPTLIFDRLRREPEARIAPGGKLILSPNVWQDRYDPKHVSKLLGAVHSHYLSTNESVPIVALLLYADFGDQSTDRLLETFFPFALPHRIFLPNFGGLNLQRTNKILNEVADLVIKASIKLRAISNKVSHRTNVRNLNPLLLPRRNFGTDKLDHLLREIFNNATYCADPDKLLTDEIARFLACHPWVKPPDSNKHALSDNILYFKSPGNDRHGYLRNSIAAAHPIDCLLNARSRLGGAYDYCLHYDCMPVKGNLKASYQNCHDEHAPPKATHVNIAPNDFII